MTMTQSETKLFNLVLSACQAFEVKEYRDMIELEYEAVDPRQALEGIGLSDKSVVPTGSLGMRKKIVVNRDNWFDPETQVIVSIQGKRIFFVYANNQTEGAVRMAAA